VSHTILAIDPGTTSIKVGLFSMDGQQLLSATREVAINYPRPGWAEQSPETIWQTIVGTVNEITAAEGARNVSAIVVTSHRGSVLALDQSGTPLSSLILWMDQRGLSWTHWLSRVVGDRRYYEVCGHPIVCYSGISKLLWLQKETSNLLDSGAIAGAPSSYLLRRLGSDELVVDEATGSFLFPLDIRERKWSSAIASKIAFPIDHLPRLVKSTDVVGALGRRAAEELRLPAGIALVAGGGDGQCAGVGGGAVRDGCVLINVGTAAGVQTYLNQPLFDPGGILNCGVHVVPDAWELEGHTQASGAVLRWFRDEFGIPSGRALGANQHEDYGHLIGESATTPPGADGLIFVPTFNGTSAPRVVQEASGILFGLRLSHRRGHVVRALLEGVALEIRSILDAMRNTGASVNEIRLVGGGSRDPAWNQIFANVLQYPLVVPANRDAALVGAAVCAAVALKQYKTVQEASDAFVTVESELTPLSSTAATYDHAFAEYRRLFTVATETGLFATSASMATGPAQ
jgi:xylulokinase